MKTLLGVILFSCALAGYANDEIVARVPLAPRAQSVAAIAAGGFSVDLPVVARVQGASAFFYTSLDVTNQSAQATDVLFEYISGDLTVDLTGTLVTNLHPMGNFHQDDFFQYLAGQGLLTQSQAGNAFGTLLVTFTNPTFTTGREASATARIYTFVAPNPRGSDGFAYRGAVLRSGGSHSLTSVIHNTVSASGSAPQFSSNIGFENVGVDDVGNLDPAPITIRLSFFDASNGDQVGPQPSLTLQPGQVGQVTDVWNTYQLPSATSDVIVLATQTSGSAQIRGYATLKDINTNDVSFFYMQ